MASRPLTSREAKGRLSLYNLIYERNRPGKEEVDYQSVSVDDGYTLPL